MARCCIKNYNFNFSDNIVTLTHDPKIDDLALKIALNSKAGYIGSLGVEKLMQVELRDLKVRAIIWNKLSKIHANWIKYFI